MLSKFFGLVSLIALTTAPAIGLADEAPSNAPLTTVQKQEVQTEIKNYLEQNPGFIREYLLQNPGVIIEALNVYQAQEELAKEEASKRVLVDRHDDLFKDENSFVMGNPDGDITLVEFLDYRCGYCKRAHEAVADFLESDGNVRLVIKEFPVLGPESVYASAAAIASMKQDEGKKFLPFHNSMLEFQGNLTNRAVIKLAGDAGLDIDQLNKDMNDTATKDVIDANHDLAGALSLTGTPGFVLGTEIIRGFVPANVLSDIAAQERSLQQN